MLEIWKRASAWARSLRPAQWLVLVAVVGAIGGAGLLLGYVAGKHSVVGRMRDWAVARMNQEAPPEAGSAVRTEIVTAYHVLDILRLPIGRAHVLAEVDDHIVFSTRLGQLNALIGDRVVTLPLDVPIGLDNMRASGRSEDDSFDLREFRVTDLLAVETGAGAYDLFASGVFYEPDCVRLVVNKTALRVEADSITLPSGRWQEIFRTQECLPLPVPGGSQSGGRIVQTGPNTLLLSVGSFGLEEPLMEGRSEYGAIYTVPMNGGAPSMFARGFRNPQGLVRTRDGEIWSTGHGPNGGDELNRIRRGAHYGWPFVTYGMAYAGRPLQWPHNPEIGGHPNYEAPRFAWLPSIGVSNLIEPDPREFPNWSNHLLVGSLRASAFFLMRLEGDRIALSEPIQIGERIRDIISLRDGRFAFSSDKGDIYFVRNGERDHDQAQTPAAVTLTHMAPLPPEEAIADSDLRMGGVTFATSCGNCHSVNGETLGGPPLNGVLGRRVGSVPGFEYSGALAGRSERWTRERLSQFLTDAQATYPGTSMPQAMLFTEHEINLVVGYLAEQTAAP